MTLFHSSFSLRTLFTYYLRKSLTSNLFPVNKSAVFSQILDAKQRQAITKKNNVCKWKPLK